MLACERIELTLHGEEVAALDGVQVHLLYVAAPEPVAVAVVEQQLLACTVQYSKDTTYIQVQAGTA